MARRNAILTLIPNLHFGGAENRVLALSQNIDRDRFEHHICTIQRPDAPSDALFGSLRPRFEAAGVRVGDLGGTPAGLGKRLSPSSLPTRLAGDARLVRRLSRLVKDYKIDLIDAHLYGSARLAALVGRLLCVPVVVTQYNGSGSADRWGGERLFYRWIDALVTDSEERMLRFRELLRGFPCSLHVIRNGVPCPRAGRSPSEVRAALGLPLDPRLRVVAQISRINESKGHRDLVEAARSVLANQPDAVFLFVGFGADRDFVEQLKDRARLLGIADRIVITGYSGPIGDVWSLVDIHVHASRCDSLPIAISEGMSLARPAVVTATGGIPELVEDGQTGLVVPPNAPAALGAAILRLLRDAELAARLGEAARRRYEEMCDPAAMARRLEVLFLDRIVRPA